jgi:hypothetical protein
VSNAVHAVIAANDAICLRLLNERPGGESHIDAVRVLTRACKQLSQVLQQKNVSQYQGVPLSDAVAGRVLKQAERFVEWAESVLS